MKAGMRQCHLVEDTKSHSLDGAQLALRQGRVKLQRSLLQDAKRDRHENGIRCNVTRKDSFMKLGIYGR